MNHRMPSNYYSACNADGSISTSRIGADNDKQAIRKIRKLLGGTIPDGVSIYRLGSVGLTSQHPQLVKGSNV